MSDNNKNYSSDFMSGDNYRNDEHNNNSNNNKNALTNKSEINGEKMSVKSSKFSVNAKPFVFNQQQSVSSVHQPQPQHQPTPLNMGNLLTLQNVLNNSQQNRQQIHTPFINHPLNQLLQNNSSILNTLLTNHNNNMDRARIQQQQQSLLTNQNFNINDIVTLATLSNLASSVLSCLPSSLQQFYSQLNSSTQSDKSQEPAPIIPEPVVTDVVTDSDSKSTVESATTVLRNPKSKYPLEFEWSFWFFKNNRDTDWKDNIILLTSVDNVEDFWSVYNHLRPVNDLHEGCDYMLFKKGIKPMWEDDENRDGGRWLISFDRDQRQAFLEKYWQSTLLSLIGSQYDKENDLINGTVVNVRYKVDKLSLWTKHYKEEKSQYKIGKRFKRILGVTDGLLVYEIHDTNHQPLQNIENIVINNETKQQEE